MIRRLDAHDDSAFWENVMWEGGALAFDVGANIGQSTRVIAGKYEKVIAFEPCKESFEILEAEMPDNVACSSTAVSSREGILTLEETSNSIRTGQLTTGEGLQWGRVVGHRKVFALTLDALAEVYGYPDFIKIDTEGHELHVIAGGLNEVFKRNPKLVVEIHKEENEDEVRRLLPQYDFTKAVNEMAPRFLRENNFYLLGEVNG